MAKKVTTKSKAPVKAAKKNTKDDAVKVQVVVADLEKKAGPIFNKLAKIGAITTQTEFEFAAMNLKILKDMDRMATKQEKEMTAPILEGITRIRNFFKPFHMKVGDAENTMKMQMSIYLEKNKKALQELDKKVEQGKIKNISTYTQHAAALQVSSKNAKIRKVWQATVVDVDKVPRQYMTPNMAAITEACRAGEEIPGVTWEQVDNIAI